MDVTYKIGVELDESELDELISAVWHAQQDSSPMYYERLAKLRALLERSRTAPRIAHIGTGDNMIVVQQ
jgi:hypothetical protein